MEIEMKKISNAYQIILYFPLHKWNEMKNPPVTSFFQLFWQDLGLLFMLMFSGPIAGQEMSVERRDGFF